MAPEPTPKKLSASERIDMISGPKVDIYVGPEKKLFRLPKLLLCHYSKYFDRCFNGEFKEGQEQRLFLEDDKLQFFEAIVQYMLSGNATDIFEIKVKKGNELAVFNTCIEFIEYAHYFGLGAAGEAVVDSLKQALLMTKNYKRAPRVNLIEAKHIELVFGITRVGSPLRTLIAQGVLSEKHMKGLDKFKKHEVEVEGYASEILDQVRISMKANGSMEWLDPLDNARVYE